jgi:hypothetical protein
MLLPVLSVRGADPAAWDTPGDVMFLAILWAGVGVAYELAARVTGRRAYAAAAGLAIAAALVLVWINLAVGIVGSEGDPANRIYGGVLAVGLVGALLARFRPSGMARAMAATALAQGSAFAILLATDRAFTGPITVFFAAQWLASAWLFRKAARPHPAVTADQ